MNIEYSYEFTTNKFHVTVPSHLFHDGQLQVKALIELLTQDGARVDARTVLSYYNKDCEAFCKINPTSPLVFSEMLRVLIRTPHDTSLRDLYERLEYLESSLGDLRRRFDHVGEFERLKLTPQSSLKLNRQDIDIFMLHSSPLIEKTSVKENSLKNMTLDFEEERRLLITTLENNSIGAGLRFEAATMQNLCEALSFAPKVLHISCHGNYDDFRKFYLAFESSSPLGLLDRLSGERLQKLLETKSENLPRLVFVSACFSEAITQVYLNAGFKCVVAVMSDCKIHDDAAKTFAREFYVNMLRGDSIRKAFDGAKVLTEETAKNLTTCCCAHIHKQSCRWLQESLSDIRRAHRKHTPKCNCPDARICRHRYNCDWAKDFLSCFNPSAIKRTELIACCCSPELPHNEGQKFILLSSDVAEEDQVLFPNWTASEIEIYNPPLEERRPPNVLNEVVGRNVEIKNLVQLLASQTRAVLVYGVKGVGKSQVVKKAVTYAYERHAFKHGVVYLDYRGKTDISRIYSRIATKLMFPGVSKKMQLIREICSLNICIVIDNVESRFIEELEGMMAKINYLLEQTIYAKFIVVAEKPFEANFVSNFEVKALDTKNAVALLKHLVGSSLSTRERNELSHQSVYLDRITKTPSVLLQIASMVKQGKKMRELLEEYSQSESHEADVAMSIKKMTLYDSRYHDLLIYLSCFPSGFYVDNLNMLEEGLQEVFMGMFNYTSSNGTSWAVNQEQPGIYILRENVRAFIFESILPREEYLAATLDHLAGLARSFVKSMACNKCKLDVHYFHFSAILDSGMWSAAFQTTRTDMDISKFKQLENNFLYYIDVKRLQNELTETYRNSPRFFKAFKELALCTIALLTSIEDTKNTLAVLKKAEQVCILLDNNPSFAKLLAQLRLVKAWLRIISIRNVGTVNASCKSVDKDLNRARDSFQSDPEGNAERCFLFGMHKLNISSSSCILSSLNKTVGQWFDEAAVYFRQSNNSVGEARAILEREHWRLKQGMSDEQTNVSLKEVKTTLKDKGLFTLANEVEIQLITFLVQTNGLSMAKKKIEKLSSFYLNERQKAAVSELHAQVYERLTKESLHKFVFLRAYPLVCKALLKERYIQAGNLCRLTTNFRKMVETALKKTEMYVCLRFNIAYRKNLLRYIGEGCRILQLSSEVHSEDSFMLECKSGEIDEMPYAELASEICKAAHSHQLEVIVLAMPCSTKGAKVLVDGYAAKFTVGFDFPYYSDKVYSQMLTYETAIQLFCCKFYSALQIGVSVQAAFDKAKDKMDIYIDQNKGNLELDQAFIESSATAVFFSSEAVDASTEHFSGLSAGLPIIDIPEVNFISCYTPKRSSFIGRLTEMHECMALLKKHRCVSIKGQGGIGKTAFAFQVAKHLSKRKIYSGGIYIFNIKGQNIRETEAYLIEMGLFSKVENDLKLLVKSGKVLLVLDDSNELCKQQTMFEPWMQNLMTNENLSLLLVNRISRLSTDTSKMQVVVLHSLQNPIECAALLLAFIGPNHDSLRMKYSGSNVVHRLTENSLLIKQRGNPRDIERISKEFETKVRSLSSSPRNSRGSLSEEDKLQLQRQSSTNLPNFTYDEDSRQNSEDKAAYWGMLETTLPK